MSKPVLLVVAGCNGSGKSTFSDWLTASEFSPFDYDQYFVKFYNSFSDSDLRERMAHNLSFKELENQIALAISKQQNFCYETNFNSIPLHWPAHFRQFDYELNIIYLCLNSLEEAKRRVAIRVQNGGHYVSDSEIETRYYDGFKNLNTHFRYFNKIHLFDSSAFKAKPKHILSIQNGEVIVLSDFPEYLMALLPDIPISPKS